MKSFFHSEEIRITPASGPGCGKVCSIISNLGSAPDFHLKEFVSKESDTDSIYLPNPDSVSRYK